MALLIRNNRVKVLAAGTDINVDFLLGDPIDSFSAFTAGDVYYVALADTGEWQVAQGSVVGDYLLRGTVEENHLGTNDQINFEGKVLQIAQITSAEAMNDIISAVHTHDNKLILDDITAAYTTAEQTKLSNISENAKDDQNAVDVPFTPVGTIVSTDVQTAIEELDTDLTNTSNTLSSHTHTSADVSYVATEDGVSDADNVQEALVDHAISLEKRNPSSSGIISGLDMVKVSPLTFQVNIGTAEVYDSYTAPELSVATELDLTVAQVKTINYGAHDTNTIQIYLTTALEILQVTGEVLANNIRENVYLGTIYVINGEISDIKNSPIVIKQTATDVLDLMKKNEQTVGGDILGSVTSLGFYADSATLFSQGVNYRNNKANPNEFNIAAVGDDTNTVDFYEILQLDVGDEGSVSPATALVIPKEYNPAGASTTFALAGTEAVIHKIYGLGINGNDRKFFLMQGNFKYADADTAEASIQTDIDTSIYPTVTNNLQLYGYACVSANSTDFTDSSNAWIVSKVDQFTAGVGTGPATVAWGAITGVIGDQVDLSNQFTAKEDALGNPGTDGYILSSTAAGARSWVPDTGEVDHVDLANIGTNTHADIDTHIADTITNPHNVIPSAIPFDASGNPVTSASNLDAALDDYASAIENRVPTLSGVISGGRIVAGSTPTTHFTVQAGSGRIVNNTTDLTDTVFTDITWAEFTDELLSISGIDAGVTHIYITSSNTVLQVNGELDLTKARDNIYVGSVVSINELIVDRIDAPLLLKQTATDVYDIMAKPFTINGSDVRDVTGQLQLWVEAGEFIYPGINHYNDSKNPNVLALAASGSDISPISFYTATEDGEVSVSSVIDVPKAINSSGGITAALTGDDATIHRLYTLGTNTRSYVLLHGQNLYDNATVAKNSIYTDTKNTTFPSIVDTLQLIGYVCAGELATDFSDNTLAWIATKDGLNTTTGTSAAEDHKGLLNIGTNTHAQIDTHIADTTNPHSVTQTQVGLSNVDNTSDVNKPVSTAQQTALDLKAPLDNPVFTTKTTTPQAILSAVSETISGTFVAIKKGSTDTDSDPNWREKARWTSWYAELGDFPRNYVIGVIAHRVYIYDADGDMSAPWITFNGLKMFTSGANAKTSVCMENGILYAGQSSGYGYSYVDFKADIGSVYVTAIQHLVVNGGISERDNTSIGSTEQGSGFIVNANVNHIAVTQDANGDNIKYIFTGGGVSIIYPDNTVIDITGGNCETGYVQDNRLHVRNGVTWYVGSANVTADVAIGTWRDYFLQNSAGSLNYRGSSIKSFVGKDIIYAGTTIGLNILIEDKETPTSGIMGYLTADFFSGLMVGDIKGAWLADSVAESLVGSELVTSWTNDATYPFDTFTSSGSNITAIQAISAGIYLANSNTFALTAGESCTFSMNYTRVSGTMTYVYFNRGSGLEDNYLNSIVTSGVHQFTFTAPATDTYHITVQTASAVNASATAMTARLADPDRSVNVKGLAVNGTITKAATVTGSEIMAYSGWSSSVYLEQAYNSDLDFGTGDFSIELWFEEMSNVGNYLISLENSGSAKRIVIGDTGGNGTLYCAVRDSVQTSDAITGNQYNTTGWTKVNFFRSGNTIYLYENGYFVGSTAITINTGTLTDGTTTLSIGNNLARTVPHGGALALIRISATPPTAEQIQKIYELEKPCIEGQACLLGGDRVTSATDVLGLSYVEAKDELSVLTSTDVDKRTGLVRTSSEDVTGVGYTKITTDATGMEVLA